MDTIAVRPDERFNEARLAAYLHGRLPGSSQQLKVRQFGGGAANLTYLLDYGTHEYVLRRPPLGPLAKSAHDMEREHRVLVRLHEAFPAAPRALLFCDDEAVIGANFFVMERREGMVVRKSLPECFDTLDAPQRMADALIATLVDLHAVDYLDLGLGDLGRPDGFLDRQVEGWWKRWQHTGMSHLDPLTAVYKWLRAHLPARSATSLVHNDYKLDNVMFDPDDAGNIVAVFDWDMCTLGDPLNDLGSLLAYWIQSDDPLPIQFMTMMPIDSRFPSRQALIERYTGKSGRDVTDIRFYHALGLYRLTVILAQIYIRFERGQTQDQRFGELKELIPICAHAALDVVEGRWS